MRSSRVLGLVFVLALVVSACGDDDATTTSAADTTVAADLTQTPGVLTVGSDIPYPPFEDFDASANVIGYDADLINEIAERLGLTVEWIDTDFDTIFTQLATGRFDVVASAVTINAERSAQVNFTDAYYNSQQAFAVNTAMTPFIDGTDDLGAGDSVGAQTGTTGAAWAADNLGPNGVEVREFAAIADAFAALEAGSLTGIINDEPSTVAELGNRTGLEIVQVIDTNERYGFGVDPARTALLAQMNAAFAAMLEDGTYQAIYDTWFEAPAGSVLYEEPAPAAIGTEENPIQVLFVPSVSADEIIAGGAILAEALNTATGLFFEVSVPTSYAATVEAMCASPDNTIGFIPANAYVLANELCGVTPALKSLRFGYTEYWAEIIVPRDSDIDSLDDLNGKTWAYPDSTSTSGFLVPSGMFAALGIVPGAGLEAGGHTGAVRAVYNNEAEFATVFFSPKVDLEGNVVWDGTDADADVPADLIDDCGVTADGNLVCGTLRPQDARRGLREEAPDVIQKVRILALSDPIPNDLMSYGPDFPSDLQAEITQAIKDFANGDPEAFALAFDAYSWDNVADTNDAEFDSIRALLAALGYDLEDL